MTDHYAVLGVRRDAEFTVIEAAHRALLKRYHPDRNPDDAKAADRAKAANAAFDVLKDSDARARYDRTLSPESGQAHEPPPRSPPPPPPHRPASSPPTQRRPVAAASGGSSRALSMGLHRTGASRRSRRDRLVDAVRRGRTAPGVRNACRRRGGVAYARACAFKVSPGSLGSRHRQAGNERCGRSSARACSRGCRQAGSLRRCECGAVVLALRGCGHPRGRAAAEPRLQ